MNRGIVPSSPLQQRQLRRAPARAFTLVELVLVLVIMAMVVGAVAASFSGFANGHKAQNAADRFVALAHWARSQAIADGNTYRIEIDTGKGKFWAATAADGETFTPAEGAPGQGYTVDDGITISTDALVDNGNPSIEFDPSGRGEVAQVTFRGPLNSVQVICETVLDEFHVAFDGDAP